MRRIACTLCVALCAVALFSQQRPGPARVGAQADGRVLLPNGWSIKPAGKQIPLSTLPMSSLLSRDGKWVLILQAGTLPPTISVHEAKTMRPVSSAMVPDAWLGMAFVPNTDTLYVSGASQASVYEYALMENGSLQQRRTFPVVRGADVKPTDFLGDLAVSPDGRLIYVCALFRNSVFVINPQSGMVTEEFKTGPRPYRILFPPDGKSYFVTSWADGSLYQHTAINGQQVARLPLAPGLMDMVWRDKKTVNEQGEDAPFQARLFVTAANTNRVHSVAITPEGALRMLESIPVSLTATQPAGMTPSALALSQDQDRLYVVCSDANAVAVADVSLTRSRLMGFVPTAWYPTAARGLEEGRLLILNGRGSGTKSNPRGLDPTQRLGTRGPIHASAQTVAAMQKGSASLVEAPDDEQLAVYTKTVRENVPDKVDPPSANAAALPPVEHIVYVVQAGRTYDQVLGDLGIGNGEPALAVFGEAVTPNHHKLAREFVLLDNFYVNGDVADDGRYWSAAAIAPPFVQRLWPNSFAGRRRNADYESGEIAARPAAGFLWTNAASAKLALRSYGWWGTNITPAPKQGPQVEAVRDAVLAANTNLSFRGVDPEYPDTERVRVFLKDLAQFESNGTMPRLILMRLGNDQTSGVEPGKLTPRALAADHDQALGMLVEGLSRGKFWMNTAIFVVESNPYSGADHVDSHRAPAFVISPYTRARGLDSTVYNTTSVLRTMEEILGLNPMTHFDAYATSMRPAFNTTADATPYTAEKPRHSLEERNAPQ